MGVRLAHPLEHVASIVIVSDVVLELQLCSRAEDGQRVAKNRRDLYPDSVEAGKKMKCSCKLEF